MNATSHPTPAEASRETPAQAVEPGAARVTVVMPAYNGEALIRRAIDSALGQTLKPHQLIVIDDGSSDRSPEIVREYSGPRVCLLQQENAGPAAARNRGIAAATGDFVAFLDADDYWHETFLEKASRFLDAHPEAVAVSCGQLHISPQGAQRTRPRFIAEPDCPLTEPVVLDDFFSFWALHLHVCTGSALIRREALQQAGGLRASFRMLEDWELWGVLATYGKWGFIPESLLVCDGVRVAVRQGWMHKHRKRWQACPTVEEWQERIVPRLQPHDWPGFQMVLNQVARNIAFSSILAGNDDRAREVVKRYGRHFQPGAITSCMRWGQRHGEFGWKTSTTLLRLRERLKSIILGLKHQA